MLNQAYTEAVAAKQPADKYLRSIRTVQRRRLLDRLAVHNVLPKYGFPVDVVELATYHLGDFGEKLG